MVVLFNASYFYAVFLQNHPKPPIPIETTYLLASIAVHVTLFRCQRQAQFTITESNGGPFLDNLIDPAGLRAFAKVLIAGGAFRSTPFRTSTTNFGNSNS
jgi:hypothetical protein